MKNKMRNAIAISGMALMLGTSGMALDASANTLERQNFRHERNLKGKTLPKNNGVQRHRKGLTGIISSVSTDSLTISYSSKDFTVTTTKATRLFNKTWQNIEFSALQPGDKIVIHGILTDNTLAARTIRDLSN